MKAGRVTMKTRPLGAGATAPEVAPTSIIAVAGPGPVLTATPPGRTSAPVLTGRDGRHTPGAPDLRPNQEVEYRCPDAVPSRPDDLGKADENLLD